MMLASSDMTMYSPERLVPMTLDLHGTAFFDEQGREIPITEEMIRQACEELLTCWQYPKRKS